MSYQVEGSWWCTHTCHPLCTTGGCTQPLETLSKQSQSLRTYTFPTATSTLTFQYSSLDGVSKCECAVRSD